MTHSFRKPMPHSLVDIELMRIGSPAAFRDVPNLRRLNARSPIRCVICKILARKLIALGQWFELRAQAYG